MATTVESIMQELLKEKTTHREALEKLVAEREVLTSQRQHLNEDLEVQTQVMDELLGRVEREQSNIASSKRYLEELKAALATPVSPSTLARPPLPTRQPVPSPLKPPAVGDPSYTLFDLIAQDLVDFNESKSKKRDLV